MNRDEEDSEFNTPEEMRVRFTFVMCLAGLIAGMGLTFVGIVSRDMRLLAWGLLALALAGIARQWLHRKGRFEAAERSLEEFRRVAPLPDEAHVHELVRLLQQWEALERTRGSARFDPWAVQSLRHDIRAIVEQDPALERLFRI